MCWWMWKDCNSWTQYIPEKKLFNKKKKTMKCINVYNPLYMQYIFILLNYNDNGYNSLWTMTPWSHRIYLNHDSYFVTGLLWLEHNVARLLIIFYFLLGGTVDDGGKNCSKCLTVVQFCKQSGKAKIKNSLNEQNLWRENSPRAHDEDLFLFFFQ